MGGVNLLRGGWEGGEGGCSGMLVVWWGSWGRRDSTRWGWKGGSDRLVLRKRSARGEKELDDAG